MNLLTISLTIFPSIFAILVLISKEVFYKKIAIFFAIVISLISIFAFINFEYLEFTLPHYAHTLLNIFDIGLIAFFIYQGVKHKHRATKYLAFTQMLLYLLLILFVKPSHSADFIVEPLSSFMFLLINLVGSLIVVYALGYIDFEEFSSAKKQKFIAILIAFLGVMNLIVITNNLEIFFALFELTTLFSYILIGYRQNEISIKNSLTALYMNQIGGVALLIGTLFLIFTDSPIYFSYIIENSNVVFIAFVFIAISALVKGAQIPFNKWLLGAMVAPTPVSAMLHSSTMVKIAPFLILKLSPAIKNSLLAEILALFGAFVFLSASLFALSKDNFKEILANSTIALLGLMIALATFDSNLALVASLLLIMFHGISKALLFMQGGVLEKIYHIKSINSMSFLLQKAPLTVFFIMFGFLSIALPPFGAFLGKFLAFSTLSVNIILIILVAFGSTLLAFLYLKVSSKLLVKSNDKIEKERVSLYMLIPSFILVTYLLISTLFIAPIVINILEPIVISITNLPKSIEFMGLLGFDFGFSKIPFWQIAIFWLFFAAIPLLSFVKLNIDSAKPYSCAENLNLTIKAYYFQIKERYFIYLGIAFFAVLIILGGFN